MIRRIERHWFEVWGEEAAQNRILKGLLALTIWLCIAETISVVILALRPPFILTVGPNETKALAPSVPNNELRELEANRSLSKYFARRHNWEWRNIETQFGTAAYQIDENFKKPFLEATGPQIKLARQKKLSQRFYVSELTIDHAHHTARVIGDRILIVEGLRATNPQTFAISFAIGARTEENPEGIYITSETLVMDSGQPATNQGTKP